MKETWDKRIERADRLAARSEGAKELLTFYEHLLRTQKEIYEFLRSRKGWLPSGILEQDLIVARQMMPKLLGTVEERGPDGLANEVRQFRQAGERAIDEMLLEYWAAPSDTQFFAKAFLQPYAQWLAETGAKPSNRSLGGDENRCPFCGGKPQLTFLQ